jgi:hypothetical protein
LSLNSHTATRNEFPRLPVEIAAALARELVETDRAISRLCDDALALRARLVRVEGRGHQNLELSINDEIGAIYLAIGELVESRFELIRAARGTVSQFTELPVDDDDHGGPAPAPIFADPPRVVFLEQI